MSRSQLRIMPPNEPVRFALVRLLRSKGFSHIPAACQPAEIFKMGFGLERGPYWLSIAREATELPPFRASGSNLTLGTVGSGRFWVVHRHFDRTQMCDFDH
jgi:hypothetical protein